MTTTVSAPGNLFGSEEHVTVYTKTAIITAPEIRTIFTIKPAEKDEIIIKSESLDMKESIPLSNNLNLKKVNKKLIPSFKIVQKAAKDFKKELKPMKITINSEIPVGSGLSSSTALIMSGYFATAKFLGANPWKIGPKKLYKRTLPLQELIHGKASGMEIYSSRFGGFSLVEKGKLIKHFRIPGRKRPTCIIGDTQISRNTSDVVKMVAEWKKKEPEKAKKIFYKIQQITQKLNPQIRKYDWKKAGKLMTKNHELLRKMGPVQNDKIGVSHKVIDQMVEAANKAGAYGAKMSGAGWGGTMFAICPENQKEAVLEAISEHGKAYPTQLGAEGVREE